MAKLQDIMAYFLKHYPHKEDLVKGRLAKMIYLADWKSAIENKNQVSNIKWFFNNYGPYSRLPVDVAYENPLVFKVTRGENMYGNPKELISLQDDNTEANLEEKEKMVLDHVIRETKGLDWTGFVQLVYSTYPVRSQKRYEFFDLIGLSEKYAEEQKDLKILVGSDGIPMSDEFKKIVEYPDAENFSQDVD